MKKFVVILFAPLILFGKAVKVDEILTQVNRIKLETSFLYSNIQKKETLIAPIVYQTSNGDFVTIPTFMGENKTNQDYVNYGLTIKYGIQKNLEIFATLNFYSNIIHQKDVTNSSNGFNNFTVGCIYQIKKEDETPSLLVGGAVDVFQQVTFANNQKSIQKLPGYTLFITSFYTVDPVVFFVKADYRINKKSSYGDHQIKKGNIFILSPKIYFAVNPFTSLNWGIKYRYSS